MRLLDCLCSLLVAGRAWQLVGVLVVDRQPGPPLGFQHWNHKLPVSKCPCHHKKTGGLLMNLLVAADSSDPGSLLSQASCQKRPRNANHTQLEDACVLASSFRRGGTRQGTPQSAQSSALPSGQVCWPGGRRSCPWLRRSGRCWRIFRMWR